MSLMMIVRAEFARYSVWEAHSRKLPAWCWVMIAIFALPPELLPHANNSLCTFLSRVPRKIVAQLILINSGAIACHFCLHCSQSQTQRTRPALRLERSLVRAQPPISDQVHTWKDGDTVRAFGRAGAAHRDVTSDAEYRVAEVRARPDEAPRGPLCLQGVHCLHDECHSIEHLLNSYSYWCTRQCSHQWRTGYWARSTVFFS